MLIPTGSALLSGVALGAALVFGMPAQAASLGGDGSATNNPELLRGSYVSGCTNPLICETGAPYEPTPGSSAPVAAHAASKPLQLSGPATLDGTMPPGGTQDHPLADPVIARNAPSEAQPQLEGDWSLGLRGTYEDGSRGTHYRFVLVPRIALTRQMRGGDIGVAADGEFVRDEDNTYRLKTGNLDFTGAYRPDRATELHGGLNLSSSQDSPYGLKTAPGISSEPVVVTGRAEAGLSRQFGRFTADIQGDVLRAHYGPTAYDDGTTRQNGDRSAYGFGGTARLSYKLTDRVSAFAEGTADRDIYDQPQPGSGASLNSWTYAARGGLSADWDGRLSAEVSAGYAVRRFDSALLDDAPTALMDAALTYRPDETMELSALFSTAFAAPDSSSGASAEIDYSAGAKAKYIVNDRVAVRGTFGAQWTKYAGNTDTRKTYRAGVGADFTLSDHATLNTDYTYETSEATGASRAEKQTVSLGMTLAR